MPPPKGRRQARGVARQQQILDAAFELFATNGYRATSLAVVAEKVGITEAGVIHHFPSKHALLSAVLAARDRRNPDLEAWVAEPGGGLESLRRLPVMARELVQTPLLARFDAVVGGESIAEGGALAEHFRDRLARIRHALADMLRDGVRRGELRTDVDVDATAAEIVAFMDGIQTEWLLDPDRIDLEQSYRDYVDRLAGALRS